MESLEVDPSDVGGQIASKCAVIRVRNDAHVTMRHLIIDGRHQGWVVSRPSANVEFESVSTDCSDTVVEYVETRGFDESDAVHLLGGDGHLKGTYGTIQDGISAALDGDKVVVSGKLYAEDLYISRPLTLTRGSVPRNLLDSQVLIIGRVVVAASAVDVTIDGITIDGELDVEPQHGVTASVTLRNAIVAGHDQRCMSRPQLAAA